MDSIVAVMACPNKAKFSLKSGSVMEGSQWSYPTWAVAIYLIANHTKGISSVRLAKECGITQKSACGFYYDASDGLLKSKKKRWKSMKPIGVANERRGP